MDSAQLLSQSKLLSKYKLQVFYFNGMLEKQSLHCVTNATVSGEFTALTVFHRAHRGKLHSGEKQCAHRKMKIAVSAVNFPLIAVKFTAVSI